MPREVVRVITPGTLVEPTLLSAETNNYLAAVWACGRAAGLAYVDISTGQLGATVRASNAPGWRGRTAGAGRRRTGASPVRRTTWPRASPRS